MRVLIAEDLVSPRKLLMRIDQLPTTERVPDDLRTRIVEWVKGTVRDLGRAA